jgi:hypothetical protein
MVVFDSEKVGAIETDTQVTKIRRLGSGGAAGMQIYAP